MASVESSTPRPETGCFIGPALEGAKTAAEETGKGFKTATIKAGEAIKDATLWTGVAIKEATFSTGKAIKDATFWTGEGIAFVAKETGKEIVNAAKKVAKFVIDFLKKVFPFFFADPMKPVFKQIEERQENGLRFPVDDRPINKEGLTPLPPKTKDEKKLETHRSEIGKLIDLEVGSGAISFSAEKMKKWTAVISQIEKKEPTVFDYLLKQVSNELRFHGIENEKFAKKALKELNTTTEIAGRTWRASIFVPQMIVKASLAIDVAVRRSKA